MLLLETYQAVTEIQFYSKKPGVFIPKILTPVPFRIEIEHRVWGIKSINLYFSETIKVNYIEENDQWDVEKQILIDLRGLNQCQKNGHAITVAGANIYLDENEMVDYSKSDITTTLISPS